MILSIEGNEKNEGQTHIINDYMCLYNPEVKSLTQPLFRNQISTGWSKKSLWCDLEGKCLRISKIFFDGVILSIYSHLVKKLELSKLHRKKVMGL